MFIEARVLYFKRKMFIQRLEALPSVYGLEVNLISITGSC
jgi:hypothetical protein